MTHSDILIVGAKGKTGARVQTRLMEAGVPIRGVSRTTTPPFDWTAPEHWRAALEGVGAAYITYHPDLSVPAAEGDIRAFCELASDVGLEHVVLLSGRNELGAQRAEVVLRESGLDWNVVQASWFAQNFSEGFMVDGVLSGELLVPAGTAGEPFVDIDDIADVVVATIMEPGLRNCLYEVTGPAVLSFADCVADISAAVGYQVNLTELPLNDYIEALKQQRVPDYLVTLLRELFADLFDGRSAYTAQGVREALGRSATPFDQYAKKTAASGVWFRESNRSVG